MKSTTITEFTCPRCGATCREHPALSREDNETLICPDCGTREALSSLGISVEEQDDILRAIHRCRNNQPYNTQFAGQMIV